MFLELVEKTKQSYVLLVLEKINFATSFDLWMSKGVHDIFAIVINFLRVDWQPKHVIVGYEIFCTNLTYVSIKPSQGDL